METRHKLIHVVRPSKEPAEAAQPNPEDLPPAEKRITLNIEHLFEEDRTVTRKIFLAKPSATIVKLYNAYNCHVPVNRMNKYRLYKMGRKLNHRGTVGSNRLREGDVLNAVLMGDEPDSADQVSGDVGWEGWGEYEGWPEWEKEAQLEAETRWEGDLEWQEEAVSAEETEWQGDPEWDKMAGYGEEAEAKRKSKMAQSQEVQGETAFPTRPGVVEVIGEEEYFVEDIHAGLPGEVEYVGEGRWGGKGRPPSEGEWVGEEEYYGEDRHAGLPSEVGWDEEEEFYAEETHAELPSEVVWEGDDEDVEERHAGLPSEVELVEAYGEDRHAGLPSEVGEDGGVAIQEEVEGEGGLQEVGIFGDDTHAGLPSEASQFGAEPSIGSDQSEKSEQSLEVEKPRDSGQQDEAGEWEEPEIATVEMPIKIFIQHTFEDTITRKAFLVKESATISKLYFAFNALIPEDNMNKFWFYKGNEKLDHEGTVESNNIQEGDVIKAVMGVPGELGEPIETRLKLFIENAFEGTMIRKTFKAKRTATILTLYYAYNFHVPLTYMHNFSFYKDDVMLDHEGTVESNNLQNGDILTAILDKDSSDED